MIKVIKNKFMQDIINIVGNINYPASRISFDILKRKFEVTDDYVVLINPNNKNTECYINSFAGDFTAFEARENSFHVDQKIDTNVADIEKRMNNGIQHGLFQKSIYACEEIFNLFKKNKVIKKDDFFVIIFSISAYWAEFDFDRDDISEVSSTIRFTKVRPNKSLLVGNLEEYAQPIMTIEFNQEFLENIPLNWWISD